jgi:micrococcal nuclease
MQQDITHCVLDVRRRGYVRFGAPPLQAQDRPTATVTRVVDGDTIEISPAIDGKEEVRLIGVDTPETVDPNSDVQPYGPQASRFTTQELEGERIELEFDQEREDSFGRLLAYVRLSDGALFNETLLRRGYAQLYIVPPNDKYEARFRAAQQEARDAERGLWGLPQSQLCPLTDRGNGIGEGSPECTDEAPASGADDDQYARDEGIVNIPDKPLPTTGGLSPFLVGVALLSFAGAAAAVRILKP